MKIHIVCYEDVNGWILGKIATRLRDGLLALGAECDISKAPDPRADINHHIIYYDYDGRKTTTETVMVTHIDTDWKRDHLRQQLVNAYMGVCMSAETVDNLAAAGLPREKLCFINPAHDGLMRPRPSVVGITSKVQPTGCKREGMLLELARGLSPEGFQFRIMGAGWEAHVKELRAAGFTVDYWDGFNREVYVKLMPSLDYYLYLGMDEGSMGFVDALAAGVPTIVTTQGYHLDAPGGITHGFSDSKELQRIFAGIARDKNLRRKAIEDWTWPEYAKRHLALWCYLLARQSGRPLDAALRAPLARMAVLTDGASFAEAQPTSVPLSAEAGGGGGDPQPVPQTSLEAIRDAVRLSGSGAADVPAEPPREMPAALVEEFTMKGRAKVEDWYVNETVEPGQALNFPRDLVEQYRERIRRKELGSYGPTNCWLYQALERYHLKGKSVAILGCETPWYEAMCLQYGGRCTTIEYRPIQTDHPELRTMTPAQYEANPEQFDAAFSISSFEHDGLGRYGDPIAPNADLEAMRKLKSLVRPGGLLFLAIPVGRDIIVWNAHRVYGRHRLPLLLAGWRIIDTFGFDLSLFDHDTKGSGDDRDFIQPVLVLQNCEPAPGDTILNYRKPGADRSVSPHAEAETLIREGQAREAKARIIDTALAENPNNLDVLKLLVSICLDGARWAEGAQACRKILQQTPDDVDVLQALTHCFQETGETETAALVRQRVQSLLANPAPAGSVASVGPVEPQVAPCAAPVVSAPRPRVLVIADVPNWIFERHVRMLHRFLGDEFDFTLGFKHEAFPEDDFDLIYPLEWNLVLPAQIRSPRKWITGIRSHLSWDKEPFPLVIERLRTKFQRVHVVSQRLLKIFEPHVLGVLCLSHGVDTEFFTPHTGADQSGRKLRVGWAGNRLSGSKKGFQEIIEPLGLVPGVELVFCGYQDRNLSLGEMRAFYDSLDAYVCASDFEGNNNALLEAAAMRRALITTDNGAVPEYLQHERSAIIVERESEAFVQAVLRLRDDPALRLALGQEARAAVQRHFEWKAKAEQYRLLFREVLRESGFGKSARPDAHSPSPHISDSTPSKVEPAAPISSPVAAAVVVPPAPMCASSSQTSGFNPAKPDYANTPTSAIRPRLDYLPADSSAAPVVTVVTPFFNAGPVFRETVESVLRQSLQQWEWLIINDGSTDPVALRLLDEFRQKDRRIRVVDHRRNKGLSAARNTGFKEARAEFVFQLDADDLIEPTALEKMAWHMATHPEYAFTTGFTVGFGSKQYLWRNGFHSGQSFLEENLVTATCLVRKSAHRSVGGYEEENRGGLEDWDFWLKAAAHGLWGSTIPEFFDWYRRRDTGREQWDNVLVKEKTTQFRARLRQRYPALWERGFPDIAGARPQISSSLSDPLPFANALAKDRPRLLFLVPHFELGGADKFNLDLIRQLQREHGYQITVVATRRSPNPWLHEFESLTPDVFVLNNFLLTRDFPLFLRYLISSRRPDAVCVSHSLMGYQLLPCLRAHFPQVPFVDYLHMEQEGWVSGGYPRYSLHHRHQLARTAVSSQHLKNWMVTRGAEASSIDVCPTNIDSQQWRRDRFDPAVIARKWNVDRTRPVILYAGRIGDQKQPRVFGEVMRQVARTHPTFTALVAGDGPDLPWLKEFTERERLGQVRFLGAIANEEMAELLALTDIFFLPSYWEGISLAVYEAMAMEAVPVSADVGGQAELVTTDCGVLVRRGANEVADYSAALLKLLRSPGQRARMAAAARDRVVRQFPIAALGHRLHATFNAARAAVAAPGSNHVMPLDLAAIHAAEIVEQIRATDFADKLNREREELLPFVKHSIEWRSRCRAGQALAEAKQTKAALEMLDTALRSAAASRNTEILLAAQVEIASALAPLDRRKAEAVLREAAGLAEKAGDPAIRRTIEQSLGALAGASKSSPAPLVSVVIPCYRQAHFLPEAVESVIAQTIADWEVIIVNDGSPDNTNEVARGLIAKYPSHRISLVEQPNRGLPAARNTGILAARSRYVLPLDADDKIRPTLLEKLLPILEAKPKVGFAYTHIQHFGALETEFPLPDFDRGTLISKDNIACVCALVRKSAWEQAGGYNEAMREGYEDWDFWVGCVEHGWDGFCLHEPLFLYRKHPQSMLRDANLKRERLIARIALNHPRLYDGNTLTWAEGILRQPASDTIAPAILPSSSPVLVATSQAPRLRLTYLISSLLGVTGGNQTLLRQAEEMRRRGHEVTIVTYTPKPDWFQFRTRVLQVPAGQPMVSCVPPSDVVVATYFTNASELETVHAPVKVYYAQGDQFVFGDTTLADTEQNRRLRELSRASYLLPGIRFVPNSRNLASAVEKLCGRRADAILPVCTDQTIFRPLQRSLPGSRFRLLIVGPDSRGTDAEPLLFKGIQDIHDALQILGKRFPHFTAVRMSATAPEIFARFPCEFYMAPADEMKTVLFGTSHIHIYASHYDSCPRPPQEAMAAGCAVVCTATPGALEYCRDGENSLLVPVQSPAAIADAVERLIHDHALREKLVEGGLATAREFPREREWNEWEAMLLRFVQEAANKNGQSAKAQCAPAKSSVSPQAPVSKSITLPPCALVGHLGQARALFGQKQLRRAWESASDAIKARPFHPEAYLLLAQIAQAAGDAASSRRCAQHARSLAPEWKPIKRFLKANLHGNAKPEWLTLPDSLTCLSLVTPRLSVCLIVKNEEKFLGPCLASVRGLADQIIVVDTGSTDRTVAIAKENGAEVYDFAWCDDFSAARNAALEHATGDWVLMLDADEELPPASHDALRKLLAAPSVMAWRLPIIDVGREAEGCCYVPRLFRNAPALFYIGRVHEQVFSSIEVRRQEWGLDSRLGDAALRHHGYLPEVVKDRNKIERNLRLLEKAIVELPDEPNLLMNYGLELVRSGQAETGIGEYRKAFDLMSAQAPTLVIPETREMLLTQFCTQLIAQRRFDEIIRVLTSPLAQSGGMTASLHFSLGLAYLDLKQSREAADQMRQCLAKRDQPSLAPINPEIRKAGPRHCLALCLAQLGQADTAADEFRLAIKDDPQSRPARFDYARFLAARDQAVEALNLLYELVNQKTDESTVWLLGGQIALSRPEFLEVALDWTAEAQRHLPQDLAILRQRAEALMLANRCEEALPLWRQLGPESDPALAAALVLCETVAQDDQYSPPAHLEAQMSREFVKWYQRLIQFNSRPTVEAVNARIGLLRSRLPSVAHMLEQALAQAGVAVVA